MFGEGKILGLGRAHERMAQIHASSGNKKEASHQRQLRDESRLKAGDRYRKAVSLLRKGLHVEATAIFDDVMSTVSARPDSYRAAVHQQIARSYFESSYFVEAADQAQEAMLTYDGLVEAHFELGVFLIAKGEATRADSVFQKAIDRFGPTRYPRSLLGQLVTYGIQPEAAQRAMDTYFPEARR
jgi:tetratricopeptide (TPR) repeat protein